MKIDKYDPCRMTKKHMLDNAVAKAQHIAAKLGHHVTGWNFDYDNNAACFHCCLCNAGADVALNTRYEAYGSGRILSMTCLEITK